MNDAWWLSGASWNGVALLAVESSTVMALRLMQLSAGGAEAQRETALMVSEKVSAHLEATATLMCGGSMDSVVGRYREQVAANAQRLRRSMFGPFAGCAAPLG